MGNLYKDIGEKIKELRRLHDFSQENLSGKLGVSTNTISRWETATYKPSASDLHKIAELFKVSISYFIPDNDQDKNPRLQALLSATGNLSEQEIDDLIEYATFRKARRKLKDDI